MRRRAALLAAIVLGSGCLNTSEPTSFVFSYGVTAFGCDTTCDTPGDSAIASAARGDTVWVIHEVRLVGAIDSITPQAARLRPDCAENLAVLAAGGTVRSLPVPTSCPDSTYRMSFALEGIDYPSAISRSTRWIIDSALAPGNYGLRGRMLVTPRLEPQFLFTIN